MNDKPLRRFVILCERHRINHNWRGQDLNLWPRGYEPRELPDCSTPRSFSYLSRGSTKPLDTNFRPILTRFFLLSRGTKRIAKSFFGARVSHPHMAKLLWTAGHPVCLLSLFYLKKGFFPFFILQCGRDTRAPRDFAIVLAQLCAFRPLQLVFSDDGSINRQRSFREQL